LVGIVRVATGRADGLRQFGNTRQAFLASLAPLIAFPLVGSVLVLARGGGLSAVSNLLATFCALLAPPVLSWWFARHWDREALWARFATAFNWCQWAVAAMATILLLVLGVLIGAGLPNHAAGAVFVAVLLAYGIWLHWFLARRALDLSVTRAALLVICVNLGTAALVVGPGMLSALLGSDSA
jgi:hypothetical protein